jgi:hypothetical protein
LVKFEFEIVSELLFCNFFDKKFSNFSYSRHSLAPAAGFLSSVVSSTSSGFKIQICTNLRQFFVLLE